MNFENNSIKPISKKRFNFLTLLVLFIAFATSIGLFFKMNEDFAFEFGPQIGVNNVEFPGYSGYFTNIQVNLRIIYLSKNNSM
jgi:hypothetical protein